MKRANEVSLEHWLKKPRRKPLVIRGARQVGKSTLVRQFAKTQELSLVELNLERFPTLNSVFKTGDLHKILIELEAATKQSLHAPHTLLFLDEIQATPDALPALRYFYEDMPELPIITAGSLLEFVLAQHSFSMPVGRIEYLHLGPMTFKEFLSAMGEDWLLDYLEGYELSQPFSETAHRQLSDRQREFLFVGGMPEAVLAFSQTKSMLAAREVHRSILGTYADDFAKYAPRLTDLNRLHQVFQTLPRVVGKKLKYSAISEERSTLVKTAIDLFIKARLFLPAYHSDCSGLPLKAGVNERIYKLFFLDVGLLNCLYGLDWTAISTLTERELVNEGELAEQFIAQHLAYRSLGMDAPDLYYWLRENKSENAEVDFVISLGKQILPIEVKAGKSGSLKSLQQFVWSKQARRACRFDLNPPSRQTIAHHLQQKESMARISFDLTSLPLYLAEDLPRLLTPPLATV